MNASVAGLSAQASHLATISDNIANSATPGYKRASTEFSHMVVDSGPARYTAGGVRSAAIRLVEQRGSLTTTTNSTDIAIAGRGMLPVTTSTAVAGGGGDLPFLMTTTGSFYPNAQGYLTTASGLVLMGVPVEASGDAPGFPRTTADALEPVRIQASQIVGSPTTAVRVSANLPARGTEAGADGTGPVQAVTYYDNLGRAQTLTFDYVPTVPAAGAPPSNEWTVSITDSAQGGAVVGEYVMTFSDDRRHGRPAPGRHDDLGRGLRRRPRAPWRCTVAGGPHRPTIGRPGSGGGFSQLDSKFSPGT
jgi:flagellar hook protein FlgE